MNQRLVATASALLAAIVLAACAGGGGSGAATSPGVPATLAPAAPASSSQSLLVSAGLPSTATFATITGGVSATITLPPASAPAGGGILTATLTAVVPLGVPAVTDVLRRPQNVGGSLTPLAYLTLTASPSLTFGETPGLAFTPASTTAGTYGYLAAYDAAKGWVAIAGATTLVNGIYTFSPAHSTYIASTAPSYFAVFATAALAAVTPPGNTDPIACSAYAASALGTRRAPGTNPALPSVSTSRLYVTRQGDASTTGAVRSVANTARATALGGENGLVHESVTLASGANVAVVTAQLRATSGVVSVDPVHMRYLTADTAANDPLLEAAPIAYQWYLYKTNVEPAWLITHGTGIKVAVIDTGVDQTNADLLPKLDKTEAIVGGVITASAQDTDGHGTNVAGLVAATTNNGYGFAATGWDVHLLDYKIFPDATATTDCQGAETTDEAAAIRDAVASGAAVINLSLGSPQSGGSDAAESQAVAFAIANNVTVVAANGNDGAGNLPDYPAAYPGVIAVGASSVVDSAPNAYAAITSEAVATYSNDAPTLVAPGGQASGVNDQDYLHWITGYSTTTAGLPADRCSNTGGVCAALFNGTSQATPQVSAAVALMMAKHGAGMTPAQAKSVLIGTANLLPGIAAVRQGAGRLNVGAAVGGS